MAKIIDINTPDEGNEKFNKCETILSTIKGELLKLMELAHINDVVIGVSGGIDSAVDLAIAAEAVSPEHIHAIYMPTKFNSNTSYELSKALTDNLGVNLKVGPIQEVLESFEKFSDKYLGEPLQGIPHENVQARIRGTILMNIANNTRGLVLNNSNKTELELGYGTLYGDLIGGLCLIGDLKKTEVYDLARHINKDKEIIPEGIITRKASAELSEGQVDPFDYDRDCDPVDDLAFGKSVEEVAKKYGLEIDYVQSLKKRIENSKFKVAQIPPIVKLTDHPLK